MLRSCKNQRLSPPGAETQVFLNAIKKVGSSNPTVAVHSYTGTHIEAKAGTGGVRLGRELLQVLVEQLEQRQVEQTDPGLLVLKYSI